MTTLSERILDIIWLRRNTVPANEISDANARAPHIQLIERVIQNNETLQLILPAFPAKSPNRNKTLGHRPDLGEVMALQSLERMAQEIEQIYAPGAQVVICSDGRVFSDVVAVTDDQVNDYGADIDLIIREQSLRHLMTFNLDDVYDSTAAINYDCMRADLLKNFSESIAIIRDRVKADEESRMLFNGIHRFMFEDYLFLNGEKSRNFARETSKALAYQVIQRSNAWSRLIESRYSSALRLSIHPQSALSRKIGIRLLPSEDPWRTPWHSVLVMDQGVGRLMPKAEAERLGYQLSYDGNRYAFFAKENFVGVAS